VPDSTAERLDAWMEFRLRREEKEEIRENASLAGMTMSEYVRRRAAGKPVLAAADMAVVRELRRLGGLMKHLHVTSGGVYSKETADVLVALRTYIDGLGPLR
jgi:hypothetical protein